MSTNIDNLKQVPESSTGDCCDGCFFMTKDGCAQISPYSVICSENYTIWVLDTGEDKGDG